MYKWRVYTIFMNWKIDLVEMSVLPKIIYRFQSNANLNISSFFKNRNWQAVFKIYKKMQTNQEF